MNNQLMAVISKMDEIPWETIKVQRKKRIKRERGRGREARSEKENNSLYFFFILLGG